MHAIAKVGPVDRAGIPWAVTRRIDLIKKIMELGQDDLPERRREPDAEILAQLQPHRGPELDRHQVARQDSSNEALDLDNDRIDRDVELRAAPGHSRDPQAQSIEPAGIREQGVDDAITDLAWIYDARVKRLHDLRLEPGLLMEADLEVGKQYQLCARYRVNLERAR